MRTRFFQRDFDDVTVLTSSEKQVIHEQLHEAIRFLKFGMSSPSFSNSDVASGGIYVGLDGGRCSSILLSPPERSQWRVLAQRGAGPRAVEHAARAHAQLQSGFNAARNSAFLL